MTTGTESIPELICELCRQFYQLGWVTGTGGGISIRGEEGIYMAPSGVQKERIAPDDVFLLDDGDLEACHVRRHPITPGLSVSECQPLFYAAYRLRDAGAVIHSHSLAAVLAARSCAPDGTGHFVIEGLEMQKGLRDHGCFDVVRIPVIPNTAREADLTSSLTEAIRQNPQADAVIVAGHGLYVWGRDWRQAKTQAECLDYLFQAHLEARRLGLTPGPA